MLSRRILRRAARLTQSLPLFPLFSFTFLHSVLSLSRSLVSTNDPRILPHCRAEWCPLTAALRRKRCFPSPQFQEAVTYAEHIEVLHHLTYMSQLMQRHWQMCIYVCVWPILSVMTEPPPPQRCSHALIVCLPSRRVCLQVYTMQSCCNIKEITRYNMVVNDATSNFFLACELDGNATAKHTLWEWLETQRLTGFEIALQMLNGLLWTKKKTKLLKMFIYSPL